MIGIGIIGCGKIAQVRHIPEYAAHPEAKLVGYYNPTRERAEKMADQYGGKVYDTVEELLADPDIQAVSICSANAAHGEQTIAALHAGKHVLCEKPMAVTLEECEAMVEAARQSGKYLMMAHNQRLAKPHALAKKLIDEGLIGKILSFRTMFAHSGPENWSIIPGPNTWFFDKSKAAMGAMADLGIHKIDLIQFLTSQRVIRATAQVRTLDKRDANGERIAVDDNAFCIFELSGGAVGTMTASWTYYGGEDNSTVLQGSKGVMRICEDPAMPIKVRLLDGSEFCYDVESIQTNAKQTRSGIVDLWMNCLINHTEPEISGESALCAMRAVFASIQSSETGRAVAIPENR